MAKSKKRRSMQTYITRRKKRTKLQVIFSDWTNMYKICFELFFFCILPNLLEYVGLLNIKRGFYGKTAFNEFD